MATTGERIKELRDEDKKTRDELATLLNLSCSAIAKYETGVRTPDDETKKIIAKYFNVSLDYLMGTSNIKKPHISDVSDCLNSNYYDITNENKLLKEENAKLRRLLKDIENHASYIKHVIDKVVE